MGTTAELSEWVAGLRFEDIPERVVAKAKDQMLSVFGATIAGSRSRHGRHLIEGARAWSTPGPSTVIVEGDRIGICDALLVNASWSCSQDFDDYVFAAHTGHSGVFGSLGLCEARSQGGRSLLTALVVANELGGRLGAASIFGPHNGQMWAYIHLLAGSALTGHLLGLDAGAVESAVGIAFSQPDWPLTPAFMSSEAKQLIGAWPAVRGVQAGLLAASGLEGATAILERPEGFFEKIIGRPVPGMMDGLGETWVSDTLSFKMYPGCAYIDAGMDALLALVAELESERGRELRPDDVEQITFGGSITAAMEAMSSPYQAETGIHPVNVNFSMRWSAAVALVAGGRLVPALFDPTWLDAHEAEIRGLAERCVVEPNPANVHEAEGVTAIDLLAGGTDSTLAGADLAAYATRFPTSVVIRLTDGTIGERQVDVPLGGAGRPRDETHRLVVDKFEQCAEGVLGSDQVQETLTLIDALEEQESVSALVDTLVAR